MKVLVVEDDTRMRALVCRGLFEHGHVVSEAETGPDAVERARSGAFDVVVLDVMLPGCSGIEVVERLRAARNRTPVLMLTARDAVDDIVAGLDAGADDYLVKPFPLKVLLARVRAVGRRAVDGDVSRITIGDLTLDATSYAVTRGGEPITLTRTEFSLLACLMRQSGRVVTRSRLLESVWGDDRDVENNTLDVFVRALRQKLDTGDRHRFIQTIRGVGYILRAEGDS